MRTFTTLLVSTLLLVPVAALAAATSTPPENYQMDTAALPPPPTPAPEEGLAVTTSLPEGIPGATDTAADRNTHTAFPTWAGYALGALAVLGLIAAFALRREHDTRNAS